MNKNSQAAVMFMGKPGAGKGTQANLVAERFGWKHFDTGEEIRHRLAHPQNETDRRERAIYDSGQLNTFEWVAGIVMQKAHEYFEEGRGIVFSGSPRSLYEAEKVVPQLLKDFGSGRVVAILLDIDDEDAVVRNSRRLTCDKCGFTMGMTQAMEEGIEPVPTVCPKCGGTFIRRVLDSADKILKERIPAYTKNTLPVIDYLSQKGILREINGRPSQETVYQEVLQIVEPLAKK